MRRWYEDLRSFVQELDAAGELLRVTAPVSTHLEITEITDLASKAPGGGKALLFERVRESPFPVLTNAFGSYRRICMALGVHDLEELASRVRRFVEIGGGKKRASLLSTLRLGMDALRFFPRSFRGGVAPCQEVVLCGDAVDLRTLPILTCWLKDGGPFITWSSRRASPQVVETPACTACNSTIAGLPVCTGTSIKTDPTSSKSIERRG